MIVNSTGWTFVSCSWCHELVALVLPRQYCIRCGHRVDVARADCDCPSCRHGAALEDLVETGLRHNEPVPDELVDALIELRGLRIRV